MLTETSQPWFPPVTFSSRISVVGVLLGVGAIVVVSFVFITLLGFSLFPVIFGKGPIIGSPSWFARALHLSLLYIAVWFHTFFIGGLIAGRTSRSSSALNDTACALGAMLGIFVSVGPLVHWLWYPTGDDIGEVRVRLENVGLLIAWVIALCAVSPFTILGGLLGGRSGGRLREASTTRSGR